MHEPPVIWPFPVFGDPNGTVFDMNPKLLLDTTRWSAGTR
jgi:hypothetical protein